MRTKHFNVADKLMHVARLVMPVSPQNREKAQSECARLLKVVRNGSAAKADIDQLGYAGALWEALSREGYGELGGKWRDKLCIDFEQARRCALEQLEKTGKVNMPNEAQQFVNDVLYSLNDSIHVAPEVHFAQIDKAVREYLTSQA
jgi:hypothetical protein